MFSNEANTHTQRFHLMGKEHIKMRMRRGESKCQVRQYCGKKVLFKRRTQINPFAIYLAARDDPFKCLLSTNLLFSLTSVRIV